MQVFTHQYEFAHGKRPRGRGSWAFFFRRKGVWQTEPFWVRGLYSVAKKGAIAEARRNDSDAIYVGS